MRQTLRCGVHTRRGTSCLSPAVSGKKRCRMHGGADGSGAPKGNANAYKHGCFAKANTARFKEIRTLLRDAANNL